MLQSVTHARIVIITVLDNRGNDAMRARGEQDEDMTHGVIDGAARCGTRSKRRWRIRPLLTIKYCG